jgi:hypothetical protein
MTIAPTPITMRYQQVNAATCSGGGTGGSRPARVCGRAPPSLRADGRWSARLTPWLIHIGQRSGEKLSGYSPNSSILGGRAHAPSSRRRGKVSRSVSKRA